MRDDSSTVALVKMAPALGGATVAGLTMNEWAAVATIIYVLAQTGLLLPKYWTWLRRRFSKASRQ